MLDALVRARNKALAKNGVIDFVEAAAWISEEWGMFVQANAEKLLEHQARPKDDRKGRHGGDRFHPNRPPHSEPGRWRQMRPN